MSKEQSIMVYEDTKTKTTRYEVNGVDITSSIEVLKEQFLNQWNNEHKLTTELSFYERNKYAKQIADLEAKLAEKDDEITQRLVIQERDYNQDKISFAIEQLEKVKEWMNQTNDEGYVFRFSAMDIREMFNQTIDNQIKSLKEGK